MCQNKAEQKLIDLMTAFDYENQMAEDKAK